MVTFAGPYRNPTEDFIVVEHPTKQGKFMIAVKVSSDEILSDLLNKRITMSEANLLRERGWRPHTNKKLIFNEEDDAHEYIENLHNKFEEAYDDYLEHNRHEICQMERYEMWRNEY